MSYAVPKEAEHLPERIKEALWLTFRHGGYQIVKEEFYNEYEEIFRILAWDGVDLVVVYGEKVGDIWVVKNDGLVDLDDLIELFKKNPELLDEIKEYMEDEKEESQ